MYRQLYGAKMNKTHMVPSPQGANGPALSTLQLFLLFSIPIIIVGETQHFWYKLAGAHKWFPKAQWFDPYKDIPKHQDVMISLP